MALFVILPIISLMFWLKIWPWVAIYGGYFFAVGLVAAGIAGRHGLEQWFKIWLCFLAIHFAVGLGYLSGLINGPSLCNVPRKGGSMSLSSAQLVADSERVQSEKSGGAPSRSDGC